MHLLSTGEFIHKNNHYKFALVEKDTGRRIDIFHSEVKLANPKPTDLLVSLYENLEKGEKEYSGDLDAYYVYERLVREARLYRFKEEEVEQEDDFDEGKVIFVCNQKSDRFEYNYKSENQKKVYRYMRSPEATVELTLTDDTYSATAKHLTLHYEKIGVEKTGFNEDSLILSRMATINELREKFDLSWLKGREYLWMHSMQELKSHLKDLMRLLKKNPKMLVVIDTETTGLNMYNYPEGSDERDRLVSIVITWKKGFSLYIPIAHKYEENLPEDEVMKLLAPIIEHVRLLTQNGLFDYKTFMAYKSSDDKLLKLNITHDLLLQNYILQPNPKRGDRSLKANVWKHLGIKQLSLADLFPPTKDGKTEIRFELLPKETALVYACPDVDLLLELHEIIYEQIPDISKPIYNVECGFMPIAAEAEYYGLKVNMEMFQKEKRLCEELAHDLQEAVYKLAGYRFNLNSPDQVSNFLYERLGCEIFVRSKSNPAKGSTSSQALKNLAKAKAETPVEQFRSDLVQEVKLENGEVEKRIILKKDELNNSKYPAVRVLQEYRNYSKLLTSFFNSIEESNKGGRLFNWINQTGAQTGRIISPLQTLPPFIKRMMQPDTTEHGWIIMDYKQIELRLMFGLAKEKELIEQAYNPANDIHRVVAARLYKMQLWEVYTELRKKSKGLNFGIPYSLGDYSLATTLYGFPKNDAHREEIIKMAREDKARFFDAMPRVERLFIDAKTFVKENGYLFTYMGRGFYYESIFEETNNAKISRTLRQCGNAMVQGLGADIFKKGTTDFQKRIKARGWDKLVKVTNPDTGESEGEYPLVRQAFFVHDEDGIPYHKKSINPLQVLHEIRKTMQIQLPGFPPFFIGAAVTNTWAEAKEDRYEIPTELLERWSNEVEQGMHTEPLEDPMGWVYNEIKKFNELSFREYFDELKEQLTNEGKEINEDNLATIFRHDVLSHDIVGMYKEKDFEAIYKRKPKHVEHLEYAVKRYVADYNIIDTAVIEDAMETIDMTSLISEDIEVTDTVDGNFDLAQMMQSVVEPDEPTVIDGDMSEYMSEKAIDQMELIELADELDEFDNPRDVKVSYQFDDTHDDEYTDEFSKASEGMFDKEDYLKRSEEIKEGYSKYINTIARQKIIKIDMINDRAIRVLSDYLKEQHKPDGLYSITFYRHGKLQNTDYKADKIDDAIVDLILSKTAEELDSLFSASS